MLKSFSSLLGLAFIIAPQAEAALIARGEGMVYDSTRNITWAADANLFKTQATQDSNLVARIINNRPVLHVGSADYFGTIAVGASNYGIGGSYVIDEAGTWHRFMSAGDFAPSSGAMNWYGATAWTEQLEYSGFDDWRLPTLDFCGEAWSCLEGELAELLNELGARPGSSLASEHTAAYTLFHNIQPAAYWGSSDYAAQEYAAMLINADSLTRSASYKFQLYGHGWAVRDGDVVAVPEPLSPSLLILGMAIMALSYRYLRRK